jgi:hypothetical protein
VVKTAIDNFGRVGKPLSQLHSPWSRIYRFWHFYFQIVLSSFLYPHTYTHLHLDILINNAG